MMRRRCSRTACAQRAVVTLTFDYAGQLAVLGPLAPSPEPNSYDLCRAHAERTSVPQGWDVLRLPESDEPTTAPPADDLLALADAIREVGLRHDDPAPAAAPEFPQFADNVVVLAERGHLKVIADR
ncbi:DUF3499 family protein [Propionibacteriaceae bacterium G1746]|uniref:DUF3499 family protein n=1 Tax=Aestuariimicrobium sp. G57 TaxID=3418485 RepID=UPI003C1B3BF7